MITTVKLNNTFIISQSCFLRMLNVYSLSKYRVYSMALLTLDSMQWIPS